jgi:hypothetical protein
MISIQKIFSILLIVNVIGIVAFYTASFSGDSSATDLKIDNTQDFLAQRVTLGEKGELADMQKKLKELSQLLQDAQEELNRARRLARRKGRKSRKALRKDKGEPRSPFKAIIDTTDPEGHFTRDTNPFNLLGAYPTPQIPLPYEGGFEKMKYDKFNYGIFNDDDYCERVDYYNLARPFNIFERKNFFTDYARDTVPRHDIIPKIGRVVMRQFSKYVKDNSTENKYHLSNKITNFFINSDGFHKFHEIGKNFLCATQVYNHIPGQRALIRKDDLIESVDRHAKKFTSNPQCFNKTMFFPMSHRLYIEEECKEFFKTIHTKKYIESLEKEPIQYLIKIGHGSHSGTGVFLLDENQTDWINTEYNNGKKCGKVANPLVAQEYISNPLLLDIGNKFDFRVYMFIASTNPLMVYYHDGVLRASLSPYDKFSKERGKHLTNSHLAKSVFEAAKTKKVYGMTEQELRDYHLWSFGELEEYLLESKKVEDPQWLENHLKPQFRKAMIHIVKMSSEFFWKQSNVFGLFGLDFMLDEKFNLWFIEANPNPQLKTINGVFDDVLHSLVEGLMEISFNLYRSRMKRALGLIQRIQEEAKGSEIDYSKYTEEYQEITKNKLEPEYQLTKTNPFVMIMDESVSGPEAYFGNITPECANF